MRKSKSLTYFVFILLAVAGLEIFSRAFLNIYTRMTKNVDKNASIIDYWESDPYLLWITKKSIKGYAKYSNFRMNNYGFRNNYDVTKEKAKNTFRIIVIGGSTAWGTGASSNDTVWTAVLERILRQRGGANFEVLNAACTGYISFQELMYLQFKLIEFSPDLIIVLDGYNDIIISSLYPEEKYQYNICPSYEDEKAFDNSPAWKKILKILRNESYFFGLLDRIHQKIIYETKGSIFNAEYYHTKGISNYFENIKNISYILKGRKIRTLFLLQPYLYISRKQLSDEESDVLLKTKKKKSYMVQLMNKLQSEYKKFAIENQIVYYDMNDIFDSIPSSQTIWYDHAHLNDLGNKILAEKVASILFEEKLIKR